MRSHRAHPRARGESLRGHARARQTRAARPCSAACATRAARHLQDVGVRQRLEGMHLRPTGSASASRVLGDRLERVPVACGRPALEHVGARRRTRARRRGGERGTSGAAVRTCLRGEAHAHGTKLAPAEHLPDAVARGEFVRPPAPSAPWTCRHAPPQLSRPSARIPKCGMSSSRRSRSAWRCSSSTCLASTRRWTHTTCITRRSRSLQSRRPSSQPTSRSRGRCSSSSGSATRGGTRCASGGSSSTWARRPNCCLVSKRSRRRSTTSASSGPSPSARPPTRPPRSGSTRTRSRATTPRSVSTWSSSRSRRST